LLQTHRNRHQKAIGNICEVEENKIISNGIAPDMVRFSQWLLSGSTMLYGEVFCPFFANTAYHTALVYLEANKKKPSNDFLQGFWQIKSLITMGSRRWKICGKSHQPFI
jgi:hypothetical protein